MSIHRHVNSPACLYRHVFTGTSIHRISVQEHLPPLFFDWPGGQSLLLMSSWAAPAALDPVPTLLPDVPPPAELPPVPSVDDEPEPLPVPAAEPPVPTELLDVPPPAEVPPVPSVEAEPEPLPEPAAEPPVPTELLDVPPPAEEPPVPRVEAEPAPQLVLPAGQSVPADEPPVPIVLLDVPPPALVPPVPTVLLVWANAVSVVPAKSTAAKAAVLASVISISLRFLRVLSP
ncbi:hypothetical protein NFC69_07270 [Rhizobium sp. SSA_523]|nr:hypothetical protein [Rhizobium sp. SSA_523]MCO5731352.1 hypothetical protein [Rhizobium sp. SSA_523]